MGISLPLSLPLYSSSPSSKFHCLCNNVYSDISVLSLFLFCFFGFFLFFFVFVSFVYFLLLSRISSWSISVISSSSSNIHQNTFSWATDIPTMQFPSFYKRLIFEVVLLVNFRFDCLIFCCAIAHKYC